MGGSRAIAHLYAAPSPQARYTSQDVKLGVCCVIGRKAREGSIFTGGEELYPCVVSYLVVHTSKKAPPVLQLLEKMIP